MKSLRLRTIVVRGGSGCLAYEEAFAWMLNQSWGRAYYRIGEDDRKTVLIMNIYSHKMADLNRSDAHQMESCDEVITGHASVHG